MASCIVMVNSASATGNLSVPEFTVQYANGNAVLTIKNQPLPSLYYIYNFKPHDSLKWEGNGRAETEKYYRPAYAMDSLVPQSSSEYTTITLPITSVQTDFRVKTVEGIVEEYGEYNIIPCPKFKAITGLDSSDWSDTQTLTVDKIPATTLPAATNTPTTPAPTQKTPANQPTDKATTATPQTFTPYTLPAAIVTIVTIFGASVFVYDLRKQKPA